MPTPPDTTDQLARILSSVNKPPWMRIDFWVFLLLALASILFSIMAFWEARRARKAAAVAGRIVKLQTITIELTEVAQKLDKLQPGIRFSEARDLLGETSRRLRRMMSPFAKDAELQASIGAVRDALQSAQTALGGVRPTDPTKESDAPLAVYLAIENDFATINNNVAELLGLFENRTHDFGASDAES